MTRKGYNRFGAIVVGVHTLAVIALFLYIHLSWMGGNSEVAYTWIILVAADIPVSVLVTVVLELMPSGVNPHTKWVVMPAILFGLLGGSQWYCLAALLFRQKVVETGLCKHCGYNLHGNVSGVCPECGESVWRAGGENSA